MIVASSNQQFTDLIALSNLGRSIHTSDNQVSVITEFMHSVDCIGFDNIVMTTVGNDITVHAQPITLTIPFKFYDRSRKLSDDGEYERPGFLHIQMVDGRPKANIIGLM